MLIPLVSEFLFVASFKLSVIIHLFFQIDGVVLVDNDYIKERKVFGHVLAAFRYGREDLDVLGLTFRKDLYLASDQIFPCVEESNKLKRPLTRLQERLIKKLGPNAFPFFFEVGSILQIAQIRLKTINDTCIRCFLASSRRIARLQLHYNPLQETRESLVAWITSLRPMWLRM